MEKKQYESKRPDQKDLEVDGSGTVTGSANIGGSGGSRRDTSINTGGGAYVGGDVSIGGGDFVGRDKIYYSGPSVDEVARMFEEIYTRIDSDSNFDSMDKSDLTIDVREIQEEVSKGDFADETFLSRRLRNIQRIDPEILDIMLATLTNSAAGFSAVVRKAAESMMTSAA
jgi:hypothetical protein